MVVFQQDSLFKVPVFFRAQGSVYAHNAAKIALFPGMGEWHGSCSTTS
jgi:hypothetical protein